MKNIDKKTVKDFGEEWSKYNQSSISNEELKKAWNQYFEMFPFVNNCIGGFGIFLRCSGNSSSKKLITLTSSLAAFSSIFSALLKY